MFRPKWTIEVRFDTRTPFIMDSFEFRTKRAANNAVSALTLYCSEIGSRVRFKVVEKEKEQ